MTTMANLLLSRRLTWPLQVYVGDYVELQLEDRPKGVAQVVELYQDPEVSSFTYFSS